MYGYRAPSNAMPSQQGVVQVLVNVIAPFTTFLHLMLNDSKYVVFTVFRCLFSVITALSQVLSS